MRRASARLCLCGHHERSHIRLTLGRCKEGIFTAACGWMWKYNKATGEWTNDSGEACECSRYDPVPEPTPIASRRGRQARKRGELAERKVAALGGGRRRGGPGRPDNGQHETKILPKAIRAHIEQAIRLGGYDAKVRYVDLDGELGVWELTRGVKA